MTASDQIGTSPHKHLASREPSTYGSRIARPLGGRPDDNLKNLFLTCRLRAYSFVL